MCGGAFVSVRFGTSRTVPDAVRGAHFVMPSQIRITLNASYCVSALQSVRALNEGQRNVIIGNDGFAGRLRGTALTETATDDWP